VKTTFLANAGVIVLVVLVACAPIALPDNEKQPDKVQTGMTTRQVERLMGAPFRTCWIYEPGKGVEESVCFMDGMVHSTGRTTQKPGSKEIFIDAVFTDTWPPKQRPSASATEVAIGMAPADVTRLKGKPSALIDSYSKERMEYRATFRNGVLTNFEDIPPPPLHPPGSIH